MPKKLRDPKHLRQAGLRKCRVCLSVLPIEKFRPRSERGTRTWECEPCRSFRRKLKKYGLSLEEFNSLPRTCEVCGSTKRLCLDHDHLTGKFRGVLCHTCNSALGYLGDDLEKVSNLLKYLERVDS